ncbi:MAG: hypothetical protein HQ538_04740 [Parcubacteria group bacterium]|nr:hypothetical protein [Parcubacteria group bacterium]
MNDIEKGGGFTPENKTQENPRPMSFEELLIRKKNKITNTLSAETKLRHTLRIFKHFTMTY